MEPRRKLGKYSHAKMSIRHDYLTHKGTLAQESEFKNEEGESIKRRNWSAISD